METSNHANGDSYIGRMCDLLGLIDQRDRELCAIIWDLIAEELRVSPEELWPEMTPVDTSRLSFPPFIGWDILGYLEREVRLKYHSIIKFDESKIPAFVSPAILHYGKNYKHQILKDWVIKLVSITKTLIEEADERGKSENAK